MLPAIQGLRAVAVLMVVAFHAGLPLPGGFAGVDVFFVISGFVITRMLMRERETTGVIRFRRFYLRRFKRLAPALAVTVVVTMAIATVVLPPLGPQQTTALTGLAAMASMANFVIALTTGGYFDAPAETNPLLHTWSLSLEEQFYLVFPAVLALAWWISRKARIRPTGPAVLLVAAISVPTLGLALLASAGTAFPGSQILLGFYSPFTRAWEFGIGAIVALAAGWIASRRGLSLALSLVGSLMITASMWLVTSERPYPGPWTLLPVIGAGLLVAVSADPRNPVSAVLSTRPLVRIGDWSYSIYLWHWPTIVFAAILWPNRPWVAVTAALVAFLPAIASYKWIEQPIRQLPSLPAARTAGLITAIAAVPMVLAFAAWAVAAHFWAPRVGAEAMATPPGYEQGCHFSPGGSRPSPEICRWNQEQTGSPVYLLGDSNAAHYTNALIDSTVSAGRPLNVATASACPYVALELSFANGAAQTNACATYRQFVDAWLGDAEPGLVVISSSDSYYLDSSTQVGLPGGRRQTHPEVKAQDLATGLVLTVRSLESSGHQVLLLHTLPHWSGPHEWNPTRCTLAAALDGCPATMPVEYSHARSASVREALEEVDRSTRAAVADLSPQVCLAGQCLTSRDGMWLYRDELHITNAMSSTLAVPFGELISAAGTDPAGRAGELEQVASANFRCLGCGPPSRQEQPAVGPPRST